MPKNITIQKIIGILLHRLKFILLATLLAGILFFLYSKFIITPMYNTSAMIYVQNYNGASEANKESGKIYSLVDGEVASVAATQHAFGFSSTDGLDVLVHAVVLGRRNVPAAHLQQSLRLY